jgi:hypothetical protein
MLGIFTEIEQNHVVSAAELSSLQILVSNATTVNMPSYVANLTGKIVNGDPANVFVASAVSPNGNLFAGCPASQLASLAADWFEGFNPVTSGNPAAPMAWTSGVLFGKGGPSYTDISQGQVGDCTLLASLAEVAARRPGVIQNMFTANPDGTYTVRFYHNGAPDYVTVNTQLPDGGKLYDHVNNGVLWAALVEKAIVQENESGWLATLHPGWDSYTALNGGDQGTTVAYLSVLTGLPSSYFGVDPANVAAAWQANDLVVLATGTLPPGSSLISDHAYAMINYNPASNTPVTLFNPWGIIYGQVNVGTSMLTTSFQFAASTGTAMESNTLSASPIAAPAQAVRSEMSLLSTAAIPLSVIVLDDASTSTGSHDSRVGSTAAIDALFADWANHA